MFSLNLSVLHVNTNLIFTSLYYNLFRALSDIGVTQEVWIPHKKYHKPESPEKIKNVKYHFSGYQDTFDRFLFHRKIQKGIKYYESFKNDPSEIVIHAHTLFSDGALAYEIYRKYGTPYVVTVRSTDLIIFWKHFPHLHNYGRKIAQNASAVTFLGPSYRNRMISHFLPNSNAVRSRAYSIPNGIDSFWLSHPPEVQKESGTEIKVLFVGGFIKRKNVETIVRACTILKNNGENITLRLVGAKKTKDFVYSETNNWIETLPFCKSKEGLAGHYRWADVFVMVSFSETFGLVYAEALSQGTPVIFTKGQGFDGWIKEGACGYGVFPKNAQEIAHSINLLLQRHSEDECVRSSAIFNWQVIANSYLKLYERAINISN